MSGVSIEDKRIFVRESAAQLASASTVTLSSETAAGLSEICQTIAAKAERVGSQAIAQFMGECKDLCAAVLKGLGPDKTALADEVLKTSLAAVRSSLFNMALGDSGDATAGQFDRLEARICELTCQDLGLLAEEAGLSEAFSDYSTPARAFPPGPPPASVAASAAANTASRSSPAEHLLRSIAKLAEKIQLDSGLRDMAFEVATAARAAHSFRFSKICAPTETDTPDALLDEVHAKAVREQLTRWLRTGGDSRTMASLRQVGGTLWLEVRQDGDVGRVPPAAEDGRAAGIAAIEDYRLPGGMWIRRAQLELCLPTFRAYELRYAAQTFLLPAADVESVFENPPAELDKVSMASLLDLPEEWQPQGSARAVVSVRCRNITMSIEVESVQGPQTYLASNISDAGPNLRGVAGVARLADGRRAPVIDIYPWLETFGERLSEQRRLDSARRLTEDRYIVFRVAGRRYAAPFAAVRAVGRVESELLMMGLVQTRQGTFHLRDIREALGLEGTAGAAYIALASKGGTIAWVVDGVEPVLMLPPEQARVRVAPFGYGHRGGRVQGLIRGVLPSSKSPIYLIEVDQLTPAGRPLRRFA